jgi:hypothetical protein
MSSEQQIEVFRQLRTSQDKYVCFLLAAAGAAIALAVNQTQGAQLAWSQLTLAAGVLLWAMSFFFGCRHLAYVCSTLYANAELLRVESGIHPGVGQHPQLMSAAREGIRQAIESNSKRASRFARWQFACLILGAIGYLAWHVLEMWLRT